MVYFKKNPRKKWRMTGEYPHDLGLRKSPNFDRATIFDQYQ